jgi:hypothetical protein
MEIKTLTLFEALTIVKKLVGPSLPPYLTEKEDDLVPNDWIKIHPHGGWATYIQRAPQL